MTISIRLNPETEANLRHRISERQTPLSEFVRDAIQEKLDRTEEPPPTPYELGKTVFGRYGSGHSDRSVRRKQLVKDKMNAKHRR